MSKSNEFHQTYEALREIIIPYANDLALKNDSTGSVYIDTNHIMKNGKPLFFGAVKIGKRYVSFHLMPIYVNPDLLSGISDELRGRMQGKSCFNFTRPDDKIFAELQKLTKAGFENYQKEGYV